MTKTKSYFDIGNLIMTMTETQTAPPAVENFFCPIGTELIIQFEGDAAQLRSSLVGLENGEFLIIKAPKAPGLQPLLMIDKPVKAIFLHNGTVFGFMSKILLSIMSPAPLFFIACPEKMQRHELRRNLRMDCSLPVVLRDKGKEHNGIIMDLSSAGCRVTIAVDPENATDFKVDDTVELTCEMLGIDREKPIRGIVRNLSQDGKRTHLGCQFDTADPGALEGIQIY